MLFYNGKQYLEGIDSVDLSFQPYIAHYYFLDLKKQVDPKHGISIYPKEASFPNPNGGIARKLFYYLHISGEYINPELPLRDAITNAICQLITKKILCIRDTLRSKVYTNITRDFIDKHLFLFISGIKIIEFCFDFNRYEIKISEDAKIIDVSSEDYYKLQKDKLLLRKKCLIRKDTTFYSYDYKQERKSTLKLYDREIWLIKKGNEYPIKFIKDNPYKMRIEFVLKMLNNTRYLTTEIVDYNYKQIINKFIPYLARKYKKYFLEQVLVNAHNHPYFYRIYELAHSDTIRMNDTLKSYKPKKADKKTESRKKYMELIRLLDRERKEMDMILKNPPDIYFEGFDNIDLLLQNGITSFDYHNENKISFKIGEDVFYKNQWHYPKYKTINDE